MIILSTVVIDFIYSCRSLFAVIFIVRIFLCVWLLILCEVVIVWTCIFIRWIYFFSHRFYLLYYSRCFFHHGHLCPAFLYLFHWRPYFCPWLFYWSCFNFPLIYFLECPLNLDNTILLYDNSPLSFWYFYQSTF